MASKRILKELKDLQKDPPTSCSAGAAEEAATVFDDAASLCIQKQHLPHGLGSKSMQASAEDQGLISGRNVGAEDLSPSHLKNIHGNSQRDVAGNYHSAPQPGETGSQPLNGGPTTMSFYSTSSPMAAAS